MGTTDRLTHCDNDLGIVNVKPNLLLIGTATDRMKQRFHEYFVCHDSREIPDWQDFLAKHAGDIVAIATNGHDGVKPELMRDLTGLRIISCYGVGYDSIDAVRAAERGIVVTHTPNVLNAEVANTAIMLMLAVSRSLVWQDAYVRAGRWERDGEPPLTRTVEGKRVGILGLGRIGETIARKLATAFDCEISYHSRNQKPGVSYRYFDQLLAMANYVDYLVISAPGGPTTRGKVSREVIDALGPTGCLINVARGSVVEEDELVLALQEGRLGFAGLDVFANEPKVPAALMERDNVVLVPHVGSATVETRQAMGDLVVENLVRYLTENKVTTPVPECAHLPECLIRN